MVRSNTTTIAVMICLSFNQLLVITVHILSLCMFRKDRVREAITLALIKDLWLLFWGLDGIRTFEVGD